MVMFNDAYEGKKVVVTGHTGFKGTWLTRWLTLLGAEVMGISDGIPTNPSMFEILGLEYTIHNRIMDIRQAEPISKALLEFQPDYVFHLAAQAIVSTSYSDPLGTISTNVIGTANVLDAIRQLPGACTAVIITSDKCYENVEWEWGYRETDHLGGKDIYSASKGAAEIIFHAYFNSFLKHRPEIRIASARAGNVIGGGDWAKDRIIVDSVLSWSNRQPVQIRSPEATRPWQHVLEPLSGYLWLGASLATNARLNGESFNFGPRAEQSRRVVDLISDLFEYWQQDFNCYQITGNVPFHEAGLLKLNCDKALFYLKWEPTLFYDECVRMVGEWYAGFYMQKQNVRELTQKQIELYMHLAKERGSRWILSN
ncbi:CDP-glucose 4,6-dehydratase [Acidithiobacillus ferriphilus]|uniref:CDP-glucose 4,6-dehydratase n=1 Tax=Acidithiobacillus ferriphilus TaxID=1689834 RepID=UPI0027DFCF91|nr:CDP-glucose 4,6-dehydratase [Acidithiobacillus ferriphilus]